MSRKSRAESAAALDAATTIEPLGPAALAAAAASAAVATDAGMPAGGAGIPYREIPLDRVFPSSLNPRKHSDTGNLPALGRSIAEKGLLQPIMVRTAGFRPGSPGDGPAYEVVLGNRRAAAARWAVEEGLLPSDYMIPARIRDCTDDELVILAGVENFDREDMEPLDEAELFAMVRPRVKPEPGETREAAVARLFHIGERTVFRRLALLRCAPEVQDALRAGSITLGAATAFSLGAPEKQREVLVEYQARRAEGSGYQLTSDDIRYELIDQSDDRTPIDRAIFDVADYHGAIIEDPDTGDRYFADAGEFKRLQELVARAKAEELKATWPWVEIVRANYLDANDWSEWNIKEGDPEAGALIQIHSDGSIEVKAPVLTAAARRGRYSAENRIVIDDPAADKARPPLSTAQIDTLHRVKTQALRRAVIGSAERRPGAGDVPLALACLGLLGAREIRDMAGAAYHPSYNKVEPAASAASEDERLWHLIKTMALNLPDQQRRRSFDRDVLANSGYDSANAAAWLAALLDLPAADLVELHARLLAERVGSWLRDKAFGAGTNSGMQLGDTPLAAAIAVASGAEAYLAELWHPDLDWFKNYRRDRLVAIVRDQLKISNADKMKKGELAQLCAEQPPRFWQPSMFPECRFQSDADAGAALAAVLPNG